MLALLLAFLLVLPVGAQEDGIGVSDGHGHFYSVTNRQGTNSYFHITKMSLSGQYLWNQPCMITGYDITATAMAADQDGSIVIVGTISSGRRRNTLVVAFSAAGVSYPRVIHDAGSDSVPTAIAFDYRGNFFVALAVANPDNGGVYARVLRYGNGANWQADYKYYLKNYPRFLVVDANQNAILTMNVTNGGRMDSRQAMFTQYGAVVPQ